MLDPKVDSVFGGSNIQMEGAALNNPNEFKDAVIYSSISELPSDKKKEFIKSKEAKAMIDNGIMSVEVLEKLAEDSDNGVFKTAVCHMAKENGDPVWDEFIKARIQERRLLNELISKYGEDAKNVANRADKEIVEACIPEYFRTNK